MQGSACAVTDEWPYLSDDQCRSRKEEHHKDDLPEHGIVDFAVKLES
jgi:hypothetical protein